uniref:LysM domain-containing protein n=1 Tax=Caenorhabditis japonica TaxID=281687 RepID=A0A8R1IB17_CAEJA
MRISIRKRTKKLQIRRYGTTQNLSSPATPCSYTIHHVQPDDTLERIALKHNCSVSILTCPRQQTMVAQCSLHEAVHSDPDLCHAIIYSTVTADFYKTAITRIIKSQKRKNYYRTG